MVGEYGIKETKEALLCGIAIQKAIGEILEDGKFSVIGDLDEIWSVVGPLQDAVKDGYKIPLEIADLEEHEYKELLAVAAPLVNDLTPDALEEYVWDTLAFVGKVLKWVGVIK